MDHQKSTRRKGTQRAKSKKSNTSQTPISSVRTNNDTSWTNIAEWYEILQGENGSDYHQEVILPGIQRLLTSRQETINGMNIIDLACGQGVVSRYLAQKGAIVTGVDLAGNLLDYARKYISEEGSPKYLQADLTQLIHEDELSIEVEPESFDAATLVLAVQNMTPLSPVWQGVNKLLKPGGMFIIVMMHPCFRIPQHSDWQLVKEANRQERRVWLYKSSKAIDILAHPGQQASGQGSEQSKHFHRPLQAYINTLGSAGLWIDHIEEWNSHKKEQPGLWQEVKDQARKEIPLFLALRARKMVLPL